MRLEGWEKRLSDYIGEVANKKFKWGSCDCLIFVSDAAKIVCGKDPMSKIKKNDPKTIRGKYKSEKKARSLIKEYRKSMPDIMDCYFNRIDKNFAQRGDIVIGKVQSMTFGIVWGGMAYFKTMDEGFTTLSIDQCKLAWRVE